MPRRAPHEGAVGLTTTLSPGSPVELAGRLGEHGR